MLGLLSALLLAGTAAGPVPDRIDDLLVRIDKEEDDTPPAVFEELGMMGTSASLRAIKRAEEELETERAKTSLFRALRHFAPDEDLRGDAISYLTDRASSRDESSAPAAAGVLPLFGSHAFEPLKEVLEGGKVKKARAFAVGGLRDRIAADPAEPYLEQLLDSVLVPQSGTRLEVIELFAAFRTAPSFEEMAKFVGSRGGTLATKRLVISAMSEHELEGDEVVVTGADMVLSKALSDKDPILRYYALTAMARRGGTANVRAVERLLKSKDPTVRRAALLVAMRSESSKSDPFKLVTSKDAIARQAAAITLGEQDSREALAALHQMLGDEDRIVRAEVIRQVASRREAASVPLLIRRLEIETGRLRADLADALETITGHSFGTNASTWARFWAREGATFQPPSEEELAKAKEASAERKEKARENGSVAAFYGLTIVSDRFALVIDRSGSMRTKAYTKGTRMAVAKQQLERAITSLPLGVLFNVISFSGGVTTFEDSLQELTERSRQEAIDYTNGLQADGGTNIHDALKTAFDDMRIDTIYLMSDGAASAGPITEVRALRDEVARWNSTRGIVIHCVSVGADHPLLRGIAADSNGDYVRVN